MVTAFIAVLVVAGLFMTLNMGQFSSSVGSTKLDLQSKVRRALYFVVTDARQATCAEIANNAPAADYIKFRKAEGINTTSGTYILNDTYVEYDYNSSSETLTRNLTYANGTVFRSLAFANITAAPFYTRDSGGLVVNLTQSALLVSRRLIVNMTGTNSVSSTFNLTYPLSAEIKIRNE